MPTVGPSESPIARRANAPSLSPTTTALLVMKLVASVVIADELQGKSRESPIAHDDCFPKIVSNGPRMLSTTRSTPPSNSHSQPNRRVNMHARLSNFYFFGN